MRIVVCSLVLFAVSCGACRRSDDGGGSDNEGMHTNKDARLELKYPSLLHQGLTLKGLNSHGFMEYIRTDEPRIEFVLIQDFASRRRNNDNHDDANRKSFLLSKYEFRVGDLRVLAKISDCKPARVAWSSIRSDLLDGIDTNPVFGVSFDDAVAVCRHLKMRLPTGDEWRFAAGGPRGYPNPWGVEPVWKRGTGRANVSGWWENSETGEFVSLEPLIRHENLSWATPVGTREDDVSHFGIYDMGGNVSEWVDEMAGPPHDYLLTSPVDDQCVALGGNFEICKFNDALNRFSLCDTRESGVFGVGFRTAMSILKD